MTVVRLVAYEARTRRWPGGAVDLEVWPTGRGYRLLCTSGWAPVERTPVPVAVELLAEEHWRVDGEWARDGEIWTATVTRAVPRSSSPRDAPR